MSITRYVARPMLAGIFVYRGAAAIRDPQSRVAGAERVVPTSGPDTVRLIRIHGLVQVKGGLLLALGFVPRLASLILAGSLVPTVLAEQRLGEEDGGLSGADRRTALLTDVALLGGLLITAADHAGRPSLAWQARRARRAIRRTTRVAEFFLPSGD